MRYDMFFVSFLCLFTFSVAPEPQAKVSVHIEEVPKDLEEQVEDLHAQVCFFFFNKKSIPRPDDYR